MAARRVRGQRQEVSGGQGAQATEEERALLEPCQGLDQPGAVVTDGGQWDLKNNQGDQNCTLSHLQLIFNISLV